MYKGVVLFISYWYKPAQYDENNKYLKNDV